MALNNKPPIEGVYAASPRTAAKKLILGSVTALQARKETPQMPLTELNCANIATVP